MTKTINTILLLFLSYSGIAQDTLSGYVRYDKSSIHTIAHKGDTFDIYRSTGGQLEAKITRIPDSNQSTYVRYYPDGTTMWKKDSLNSE
jgi:hypothetical protein